MEQKKQPPEEQREALILKDYLGQYYRATRRRRQLEERLKNICAEMNAPIGGMNYSPVNISSGRISQGSAAFTLRKSEIETRIEEQKKQTEVDLLRVMDILDYLDPGSDERMLLELRHIDNLSWAKVEKRASMSRSTCFDYYSKGINKLLTFKRVRKIIAEYAEEKGL